jgi:hypothetical protein
VGTSTIPWRSTFIGSTARSAASRHPGGFPGLLDRTAAVGQQVAVQPPAHEHLHRLPVAVAKTGNDEELAPIEASPLAELAHVDRCSRARTNCASESWKRSRSPSTAAARARAVASPARRARSSAFASRR